MAWNNAEPYVPAQHAPVKLGVVKIKTGLPRVSITIVGSMLEQLGDPRRCNVFVGDGDEAGQVLLQFDADGAHALKKLSLGGARVQLANIPGMGTEKRKPAGVRFERAQSDDEVEQLTIWLPW